MTTMASIAFDGANIVITNGDVKQTVQLFKTRELNGEIFVSESGFLGKISVEKMNVAIQSCQTGADFKVFNSLPTVLIMGTTTTLTIRQGFGWTEFPRTPHNVAEFIKLLTSIRDVLPTIKFMTSPYRRLHSRAISRDDSDDDRSGASIDD